MRVVVRYSGPLGTFSAESLRAAEEETGPMNATAGPGAKPDTPPPGVGEAHPSAAHPAPAPDDETARLFAFFGEIHVIAQLSGRMLEAGLPAGFHLSHFSVLDHLACHGDGATPLSLARAFQVPKTTMTHTLSGLEKAGLIRFAPHPSDGRSKRVTLTDEGRRFRDAAIARLEPELALMAARFPADAIAATADLLAGMRDYLDHRRGD